MSPSERSLYLASGLWGLVSLIATAIFHWPSFLALAAIFLIWAVIGAVFLAFAATAYAIEALLREPELPRLWLRGLRRRWRRYLSRRRRGHKH